MEEKNFLMYNGILKKIGYIFYNNNFMAKELM